MDATALLTDLDVVGVGADGGAVGCVVGGEDGGTVGVVGDVLPKRRLVRVRSRVSLPSMRVRVS